MRVVIEFNLPEDQAIPEIEDIKRLTDPNWLADWWHIDDVMGNASEDITEEEAQEVLALAERRKDCNIGLNWTSFEVWTDEVISAREGL
jgi:hypothetical protein